LKDDIKIAQGEKKRDGKLTDKTVARRGCAKKKDRGGCMNKEGDSMMHEQI